ncbi:MAG: hypothetical protein P8L39_10120 [Halioglobus sp.]|nr:hypothetical protein [Halioglobus sp.]
MRDPVKTIPISTWLSPLIGKFSNTRLESKIYFFSCSMIVIAGLISLAINLYQYVFLNEHDLTAIFSCIFLIVAGAAFHNIGGRLEHPEKPAAALIILTSTLIGLNWLTNQGSQGTLPLWFSPLFIMTGAMIRGRLLSVVSTYLILMIAVSLVLEWHLPQSVLVYGSSEAQLFDTSAVLLLSALICFSLTLFMTYAYRQERDMALALEIEKLRKENLLDAALLETNQLKSLLPMCAWCKKIKNVDGSWASFERYLSEHRKTDVTHGICPACLIETESKHLKDS